MDVKSSNKGAVCSNLPLKDIILNIFFCTTFKEFKYALQQQPHTTFPYINIGYINEL